MLALNRFVHKGLPDECSEKQAHLHYSVTLRGVTKKQGQERPSRITRISQREGLFLLQA